MQKCKLLSDGSAGGRERLMCALQPCTSHIKKDITGSCIKRTYAVLLAVLVFGMEHMTVRTVGLFGLGYAALVCYGDSVVGMFVGCFCCTTYAQTS